MKNHFLIFSSILLLSFSSISQEAQSHKEGYFVSQDGKLYWKGGKPLYLFVSENPDGSNAQRLESETSKDYVNPMYLDTEGINYIRSNWAVDKDGNYASPKQEVMFEVYKDGTAPSSSVAFSGAVKYNSGGETFYGRNLLVNVTASDAVSGVRSTFYSRNEGAFQEYNDALTFESDEDHLYTFYSVDNVGNKEAIQAFNFRVDLTGPVAAHSVNGDQTGEILSPRSTIELEADDNKSGVKSILYKIDDGSVRRYYGAISLTKISEGDHSITYYAVDNVDNTGEEKVYQFFVDRSAPEVVAVMEGDQFEANGKIFGSVRTRLKLESSDNKSGVKNVNYRINNGEEAAYNQPFSLPEESGSHRVVFFGTDNVNNDFRSLSDASSSISKTFTVDMTPPKIAYSFDGEMCESRDTTFITSQTLIVLKATDNESGVKRTSYRINGGEEKTYSEAFTISKEGYYTIDFYGTDQVNNQESSTFSFIIDNTGPMIETILSMEPVGSISLDDMSAPLAVYSSGVKLYLGATDGMVDTQYIYYSMNDQKEILYTEPVNIDQKGINSFKIKALDRLGNISEVDASKIFIK